jgi:membrane protease YdiL (CAAX protease family)
MVDRQNEPNEVTEGRGEEYSRPKMHDPYAAAEMAARREEREIIESRIGSGGTQTTPAIPGLVPSRASRRLGPWQWVMVACVLLPVPWLLYGMSWLIPSEWVWKNPAFIQHLETIVRNGQLVGIIWIVLWLSGEPFRRIGVAKPRVIRDTLWALGYAALMLCAYALLAGLVYDIRESYGAGTNWVASPPLDPSGTVPAWLCVAASVVSLTLNSIVEETVMRGIIITKLRQATGSVVVAVIASALVTASYHIYQGIAWQPTHIVYALLAAAMFVVVGRLWPLILGHTLYNVFLQYGNVWPFLSDR